jgi:hypothetical protein
MCRDLFAAKGAKATSLAGPTVPRKMADADSAPRCIFSQIVGSDRAELLGHIQVFLAENALKDVAVFDHR